MMPIGVEGGFFTEKVLVFHSSNFARYDHGQDTWNKFCPYERHIQSVEWPETVNGASVWTEETVSDPGLWLQLIKQNFVLFPKRKTSTLRQRKGRAPLPSITCRSRCITWSCDCEARGVSPVGEGGLARTGVVVGRGCCTTTRTWLPKAVPTSSRSALWTWFEVFARAFEELGQQLVYIWTDSKFLELQSTFVRLGLLSEIHIESTLWVSSEFSVLLG